MDEEKSWRKRTTTYESDAQSDHRRHPHPVARWILFLCVIMSWVDSQLYNPIYVVSGWTSRIKAIACLAAFSTLFLYLVVKTKSRCVEFEPGMKSFYARVSFF